MNTRNRRDRSRISGDYPLQIRRRAEHHHETVAGTILDVAAGGFCIVTDRPLLRGEQIVLELTEPDDAGRSFPALIVWCEPDAGNAFRAGAEFLEPLTRQQFIRLCALTCGAASLQ